MTFTPPKVVAITARQSNICHYRKAQSFWKHTNGGTHYED